MTTKSVSKHLAVGAAKAALIHGLKISGLTGLVALTITLVVAIIIAAPITIPFFLIAGVGICFAVNDYQRSIDRLRNIDALRDQWSELSKWRKLEMREKYGLSGPEWD